jgi:hypothetical protein
LTLYRIAHIALFQVVEFSYGLKDIIAFSLMLLPKTKSRCWISL